MKTQKKIKGYIVSCPESNHSLVYTEYEKANEKRILLNHKHTCSAHSIKMCEIIINPKKK